MKNIYIAIATILLFTLSCTKQVTQQTVLTEEKAPVHFTARGDTTTYIIGFSNKKEKRVFTQDFKTFLENYSFEEIQADTIKQYFNLRIVPEAKDITTVSDRIITTPDKTDFIETDIKIKEPEEETIIPTPGGNVTIYTHRKFIDNTLSELMQVIPFSIETEESAVSPEDTASSGFLIINQISPVKIQIICIDKLINNSGRHLTAFDIVQAWTEFVKNNPAEGLAVFYYVKGIKKFIKGEEGIIQGFSVANEKTIIITLEKPDSYALQRLNSSKLIPPSLNTGQFYVKKQHGNKFLLKQNALYPYNKSFLDQCTIICGNDKNPIVSYSLNKYDMVILYKKKDLGYARRSLLKNSNLVPFSADRYFISLASKSSELRQYLNKLINPVGIQTNAIKAEGELISAIESDNREEKIEKESPDTQKPYVSKALRILYNSDDPASTSIAEKIFSDLSHSGLTCALHGLTKHNLEIGLIDRDYDIAIGWTSKNILTNKNKQLRLAAIWFNNEYNETKRISESLEIPLFTIQRYALCKKDIKFFRNRLSGIYRELK